MNTAGSGSSSTGTANRRRPVRSDRPLVTGCVYNDDNKPPYDLPDNKTMDGWKSNSSKGGGGYNELVFEDKKGSEKIQMHGEKDHEVIIKDTQTFTIGEAFTAEHGAASRNWTLKQGDDKLMIEMGNQTVTLQMGNQNTNLQLGNQQTDLDVGSHTTNAMQGITLNVMYGLSSIAITPSSISMMSPTISMLAEAEISMEALSITIAAPDINIAGIVNIAGELNVPLVNGGVPVTLG